MAVGWEGVDVDDDKARVGSQPGLVASCRSSDVYVFVTSATSHDTPESISSDVMLSVGRDAGSTWVEGPGQINCMDFSRM